MSESFLRASDADRERVAAELRDHAVAGRLDTDELDERLGRAYAAKTYGDLDALVWDLPRDKRAWPPPATRARKSPTRSSPAALMLRGLWWATMAMVALTVVAIVAVAVATGWFIAVCIAICCAMRKRQACGHSRPHAGWARPQGPVRI
jgi:hypothetical protein